MSQNYPKGENEKYIYVTTLDNCKDDILFMLLGVSAGQEPTITRG
ncbi:MAG: hypothetical protein QFX30_06825 [Methanothermobacter sp.]|nr:hypothetical protein [Methanothermobacter sp.]MDI9618765.1 hypothetical protein [Methanothermobacter sp.]